MLQGFTRRFKPLEILNSGEIADIHKAVLDILWETGVLIYHERALQLFRQNGCKVQSRDKQSGVVRFPPTLVEESLRRCPTRYELEARDRRNNIIMDGDTLYFNTMPGMQTVDLSTKEPRNPTFDEYTQAVRVLDALDNLHILNCYTPYFGYEGVPEVLAIPEGLAVRLKNTTKFNNTCHNLDCEIFNIEMARATEQEIMISVHAASPLTWYTDAVEAALRTVGAGFPLRIVSAPSAGASSPATLAGSTVSQAVEIMPMLVLAQILRPGTRVLPALIMLEMNMRTGAPNFNSMGQYIQAIICNQLWRRYGIPIENNAGWSCSKGIDFQCGYEKAMGAIILAAGGASAILLHGGIHGELSFHPYQAIVDDDIAGSVGRFVRGEEVNEETIALDLIKKVGPIPGNFLNTSHTREWWQNEQFLPKAADRLTYPDWMKTGKKNCVDYASELMGEILEHHQMSIPLTSNQDEDINRILNEAKHYYKKKGLLLDAK